MISSVRLLLYTVIFFVLIIGCASSSQKGDTVESYENLVTIQEPDDEPHQQSKVYIDSVKKITDNDKPVLMVSGTFPDACTKLEQVTHRTSGDSLYLDIKAWRNPEMMCSQVLTPFSYIYSNITEKELSTHEKAIVNGSSYSL
ncbi:hypothetical protein [Fodinibius sp.]|uniref:hypothetical protein n=1 Tax=Fodinibius sp. TaxID=1872440 RepID=UPI002ACE879F|nr:hypothetical protein [Fodinibius sp.]MDZ7658878.1 hypothetical protein [Fodinibius sp.]